MMRLLGVLLLCLTVAAAQAAEPRFAVRFYCMDVHDSVLLQLGWNRATGALGVQVSTAAALALLDADTLHPLGSIRIEAVSGQAQSIDHTRLASYLEADASGDLVEKTSEWNEGLSAHITVACDSEGRIRIDGQLVINAIDARAILPQLPGQALGKPLQHFTQTIVPAAVLRSGEACVVPVSASPGADSERVVVVVAERLPEAKP